MDDCDRAGPASLPRICISGWYGLDNTGDEAILLEFIREMSAGGETHLTILAADAKRAHALYARPTVVARDHFPLFGRGAFRNILRGRIMEQMRALKSADLFVLGGGSLIHDRSTLRNLIDVLDEIWIGKLYGRRAATYAIGVGPLRRRSARWLVAKTLTACDLVTVRDHGSKRLLVEIGVPESKIHVVADPALLLRPMPLHEERLHELTNSKASLKEKAIGVFLNDDLGIPKNDKQQLIAGLAEAFDNLHATFGSAFVFIPMMCQKGDDDRLLAHAVARKMKYRSATRIVETTFAPDEMMWLAGQFRVNITLRLHALLFSLAQETPVVAIAHDPKIGNAMEEFGLERFCIALDTTTGGQVQETLGRLLQTPDAYLMQLRAALPVRLEAARHTFDLLKSLLPASTLSGSRREIRAPS